jgi:hypothetical protein
VARREWRTVTEEVMTNIGSKSQQAVSFSNFIKFVFFHPLSYAGPAGVSDKQNNTKRNFHIERRQDRKY